MDGSDGKTDLRMNLPQDAGCFVRSTAKPDGSLLLMGVPADSMACTHSALPLPPSVLLPLTLSQHSTFPYTFVTVCTSHVTHTQVPRSELWVTPPSPRCCVHHADRRTLSAIFRLCLGPQMLSMGLGLDSYLPREP